jgi:hypothetical protein
MTSKKDGPCTAATYKCRWLETKKTQKIIFFHIWNNYLAVPSRNIASIPAVWHCSSQGLRFVIWIAGLQADAKGVQAV